jgi:hypothetical protein
MTVVMMAVRTWPTGPANPAHGGQAFVVRLETAIAGTAPHVVMGTPIRLSGFFDADDSRQYSQDEQQKPHGHLLVVH